MTANDRVASGLSRRVLLGLFGIALTVRLVLLVVGPWQDLGRVKGGDSTRYLTLADNLRAYHTFGLHEEEPAPAWKNIELMREANGTLPPRDANGLRPEGLRTPGYPAFIEVIQAVVSDIRAVLVVQCLLGALLACLVPFIATALGLSSRGAFLAGLLWAIHPALVLRDCLVSTESLFNVCCVFAVFLAASSPARWCWLVAGSLVGLAGLVRPLGLLYLPALLVLIWPHARPRLLVVISVVVLAALPSLLWALRNQSVGEGFRVSTVGNLTIFYYVAGYSISEERGDDWLDNWTARSIDLSAKLKDRIRPGEDVPSAAQQLAFEEMRVRPAAVARVLAKSQLKLFVAHSLGEMCHILGVRYHSSSLFARLVLRESNPTSEQNLAFILLAAVWTILNVAIVASAVAGVVIGLRQHQYALVVVCVLTVALFAVATMSQGLERMRMPIMLPLFLLAANVFRPAVARPDRLSARQTR